MALAAVTALNAGAFKLSNGVQVPLVDSREYLPFTLPNGLRVIAVSDRDAETSAAALEVSVGCWSDPPEIAGMAHFVEHMCFLGTETYPNE